MLRSYPGVLAAEEHWGGVPFSKLLRAKKRRDGRITPRLGFILTQTPVLCKPKDAQW